MRHYWLSLVLIIWPTISLSETVFVESGEHTDFSRLVFEFSQLEAWEFGRVPDGYELRFEAQYVDLDFSRVFKFIPRKRLLDVSSPAVGRVKFRIDCDCTGDVFEIRDGRLVVDIKDGAPTEQARFEAMLLDVNDIATLSRPKDIPQRTGQEVGQFLTAAAPENTADLSRGIKPADLPSDPISPSALVNRTEQVFLPPSMDGSATPSSGIPNRTSVDSVLPPLPEAWPSTGEIALDLAGSELENQLNAGFKNDLLRQLSRAVSQGLVEAPMPHIFNVSTSEESIDIQDRPNVPTSIAAPSDGANSSTLQMRLETALDRANTRTKDTVPLTSSGQECLDPDIFALSEPEADSIPASPYLDLWARSVTEFDEPDGAMIEALVRRYIYLGFGAESKLILDAFKVPVTNLDILIQMAEIADNGVVATPGRLASQINCSTSAAMWAVLAKPEIPAGADIDLKMVLRAFSALPPHLRERFGPWLVERFLLRDDTNTATAIRDLMDRAQTEHGSGYAMVQAELATHNGDRHTALTTLRAVAFGGTEDSPHALIDLIETRLSEGELVSEEVAAFADALSVDHRGTELGRDLTRVAIRAFAVSGRIQTTFDRISQVIESGDLTKAEATELRVEAHLRNAQYSLDPSFLEIFYRNEETLHQNNPRAATALSLTAGRLVGLGLAEKAISLYARSANPLTAIDHQVLAAAELATGNAGPAISRLKGREDDASLLLLAQANEAEHNFAAAASIYTQLQSVEDQRSNSWRAGSWEEIAANDLTARAEFATVVLAADGPPTDQTGDRGVAAAPTELPTLAQSQAALDVSSRTREAISQLLGQ